MCLVINEVLKGIQRTHGIHCFFPQEIYNTDNIFHMKD